MITGIAIENFKGIRDRVEIELQPITLLFGANSAGKSSMFHALHYAREVFERHNLSPDLTTVGGNAVDLGGFHNFIHDHNVDLPIRLIFQVDCKDWSDSDSLGDLPAISTALGLSEAFDCFGLSKKVTITVEIRWSETLQRPYVSALRSEVDGAEFLSVTSDFAGRRVEFRIAPNHPRMYSVHYWRREDEEESPEAPNELSEFQAQTCVAACLKSFGDCCQLTGDGAFYLEKVVDAFLDPQLHSEIPFANRPREELKQLSDELNGVSAHEFASEVNEGIGRFLWPALRDVRDFLNRLRHLGPLREVPSRRYVPPSFTEASRWASGLGSWDALQNGSDEFVQSVGNWLGDEDKLNSGYRVERRKYKEIDLADPLIIKLLTGRAFDEADDNARIRLDAIPTQSRLVIVPQGSDLGLRPHDVGIGISQVVPVVVTALEGERRLLVIEQPELHLHPKLQAELGDLFIQAALGNRRHLIVLETHSEHLILRLLRRIRETTDGEIPNDKLPVNPDEVAVYYIEPSPTGVIATRLRIDETGEFIDRWPKGFFDERAKELF